MYGRVKPRALDEVVSFLGGADGIGLFVDIGSGLGVIATQMAVCYGVPARGVEVDAERHSRALELLDALRAQPELTGRLYSDRLDSVRLRLGDFGNSVVSDERDERDLRRFLLGAGFLNSATDGYLLLFANNAERSWLHDDPKVMCLDEKLALLLCFAPVGTRLVTVSDIQRLLPADDSWYTVEESETSNHAVTWSSGPTAMYAITKTRDHWHCREHGCREKNLLFQDISVVSSCRVCGSPPARKRVKRQT